MKIKIAFVSILLIFSTVACQSGGTKSGNADLSSKKDSLSYAVGLEFGQNLKRQKVDVDIDLLLNAIRSGYYDTSWALTRKQTRKIIIDYQNEQYIAKRKARQELGRLNLKKGQAFLAKNKKKKGVITTKSGLQYKILKKGKGASPRYNSKVKVNYKGYFINGKVFDSSYKRGKPAEFIVNRVIKGWTEALMKMKVGSKWKIWIPSKIAYGYNGSGKTIGPNKTLVFEIELLKIENQNSNKKSKRNDNKKHAKLKPLSR